MLKFSAFLFIPLLFILISTNSAKIHDVPDKINGDLHGRGANSLNFNADQLKNHENRPKFVKTSPDLLAGMPESLKNRLHPSDKVKKRWTPAEKYREAFEGAKSSSGKSFTDGFLFDSPWTDFYIGNPPNYYLLNVETGFDKTWLVNLNYGNAQPQQQVYDPSNSSFSRQKAESQYGSSGIYNFYGPAYTDVFIDDVDWWNQTFGTIFDVYTRDDSASPEIPYSGVLGLAWDPSQAKTAVNENSSAIFQLLNGKPQQVVSLWQDRDAIKDFGVIHEFLIGFGWIESDLCDTDITYVPLKYDYYNTLLSFNVDAFRFGTYEKRRSQLGKVDTGLAMIFLPDAIYTAVYQIIDPDYDWDRHVFTTDCSNVNVLKDWKFTISGREFALSASDYLVDIFLPDNKCVLAIELSTDYYIPYALGNPFLRRYCQFLDVENNRLGLSDAIHSPPDIVIPTTTPTNN